MRFGVAVVALSLQGLQAQSPGTLTPTGSPQRTGTWGPATLLRDGRVLFTGGQNAQSQYVREAEIYDPVSGSFQLTGRMTVPRANHSSTLLADGRVLIAGGYMLPCNSSGCVVGDGSAELYDPVTGTFQATRDKMVTAQANSMAVVLPGNKVLFVGGNLARGGVASSPKAELYDPSSQTFHQLDWGTGWGTTTTLLPNNQVLLAGGWNTPQCYLYDPYSGTVKPAGRLASYPIGVYWHTATLLGNGTVLIAGGATDDDAMEGSTNVEIYDPVTERFTFVGSTRESGSKSATLLPGGTVLFGGFRPEIFDPVTQRFSSSGITDQNIIWSAQALLGNGKALLNGLRVGTRQTSSALYSPPLRVISAASFAPAVAAGSLASLVGSDLAAATVAMGSPAATSLGGVSLRVRDSAGTARLARLLYVSPSQINFEVPAGTVPGEAAVEVIQATSATTPVAMQVNTVAPALFALPGNKAAAYAVRIEANGSQTILPASAPIVLDDRRVFLAVFGTGIRDRSALSDVRATVSGREVLVTYAGPAGSGIPGLDQVNVELTSAVRSGHETELVVTVGGVASNSVWINIQ